MWLMTVVAHHTLFRLPATLAVIVVMVLASSPAHAQQVDDSLPPLADLTITSHIPGTEAEKWEVTVKNNTVGARPGVHVHLVKVRITQWGPVHGTSTWMWTIRDLPPGGSAVGPPNNLDGDGVIMLYENPKATDEPRWVPQRLYAEIIESDPVESPRFRFNNATENWAIEDRHGGAGNNGETYFAIGDVALDVASISDRLPQAGGATTFTMALSNDPDRLPNTDIATAQQQIWVFDVQVEISLSQGLLFAATQPEAATGTTFDASTGIWNVGATDSRAGLSLPVAVNLTAESLADLPLQERCLTAKVVRAVPWFANDPVRRVNDTATACLGTEPLSSGTMDLIEFYPCISATSTPCTSEATLELVVDLGEHVAQPEAFIFHVPDPGGRFTSTRHGSVIWSTANLMDMRTSWTRLTSDWSVNNSAQVTSPGGGDAPGRWLVTDLDDSAQSFDILGVMGTSTITFAYDLADWSSDPADYILNAKVDFWALGTYKALLEISGVFSGATYTDSATYIFHVGPMAELEVRDGGPNPAVPAGQRAFTIAAANNGPDTAPNVEVTLEGVPAGATVGGISDGSYDAATGVWTIGELETAEYRRSVGRSDGATLTLLTGAAGGAEIAAAISNNEQYTVCVDSSGDDVDLSSPSSATCTDEDSTNTWHTTDYYDYLPGNSTTTIAARHGSGVGLGTRQATVGISLTWPPQPKAMAYGVDVSEDGGTTWSVLELWVSGASYTHVGVPVGATRHYRVHAIDEDRRRGLPFTTASATAQEPGIRTVVRTVTVAEDPFAYFPSGRVSRSVAENSAPGTPVGAPVAVVKNSGNDVVYSLEGADAALFGIEPDSGQILVGQGTVLDFESDRTSYSVEVVAAPSRSSVVRTTVDIEVVDVAEPATEPEVRIVTVVRTETVTVPEEPVRLLRVREDVPLGGRKQPAGQPGGRARGRYQELRQQRGLLAGGRRRGAVQNREGLGADPGGPVDGAGLRVRPHGLQRGGGGRSEPGQQGADDRRHRGGGRGRVRQREHRPRRPAAGGRGADRHADARRRRAGGAALAVVPLDGRAVGRHRGRGRAAVHAHGTGRGRAAARDRDLRRAGRHR